MRVGFSLAFSKSVLLVISARSLKKHDLWLQNLSQSVSLGKPSSGLPGLWGLLTRRTVGLASGQDPHDMGSSGIARGGIALT